MNTKMTQKLILTFLLVLFSTLNIKAQSANDIVYLKDGSIIKGTIMEMNPSENLKIKTSDGSIFVYQMSEVQKIEKVEDVAKIIKTKSNVIKNKIQQNNNKQSEEIENEVISFIDSYYTSVTQQTNDYLQIYELGKISVFSDHHHHEDAYLLIKLAAKNAILKDKSDELLSLINEDLHNEKTENKAIRTVWKLSAGHSKDWCPIIRGLERDSVETLDKPCPSESKGHH
tara:strand:+ start:147 stop:830 length:684 start_codon:yes stop_codon:yes gene_type:complete